MGPIWDHTCLYKKRNPPGAVVATPSIPKDRRQKQADLSETNDSLAYRVSSRTGRVTQRNPVGGRGRES